MLYCSGWKTQVDNVATGYLHAIAVAMSMLAACVVMMVMHRHDGDDEDDDDRLGLAGC